MAHSKRGTLEIPAVPTAPPTLHKPMPVTESQPSLLLSKEENQCVFEILGSCKQERMIGINFANESEASRFREALDNLLELRRQRKNSRKSRLDDGQWQKHQRTSYNKAPSGPIAQLDSGSQSCQITKSLGQRSNTRGMRKGKLSKADIGTPANFRHVQHVGFDPKKGFDLNGDLDTKLQAFLKKYLVKCDVTRFIDQHGGLLDAVKNEIIFEEEDVNPSPLTAGTSNVDPANKFRPSIPSRRLPVVSSAAQGSVGPPPPPPPPPLCVQEPAPPPLAPLRESQTNESEPTLRDSIASIGDERSNLMLQIQKGISLKRVVAEPVKQALTDNIGGLAGALARSLADRNKAMHLSDSDTSDSVEAHDLEDDEWE